ncbi:protein-disulfide reductase DsbD domain-containing protein [Bartonella sp. WD16.2]|uniref:protein-disulfide reductase DsbD domain-containing protein n=1 Tax=Bartonella sp. WD16.2 TaxID=1933904 RepID=UPI00099ABA7E|nr:protein-disulfide reductase DsbD domain-containing protein [Bartonella sp. WD16.2]AQX19394.1 Thiol-disulfide interchange protein [Bartonella sp. WD16.2]
MKKIQIFLNLQRISNIFYKKFLITFSLTCVLLSSSNFTIAAQKEQESHLLATPWYESKGGSVRLAITKPSPSGIRNGFIEVMLKPKWKTYWRNPGNSGMAPFFNFNQQVSYEIFYPIPQLYETENDWSLGYKNKVVLPFSVSDSSENLSGSLTLGLCDEICIPFTVDFDFSSSTQKNTYLSPSLLKHAQAALPRIMNNELKISAEKNKNTLFIKIQNNSKIKILSLFLDGGDMQIGPAKKVSDHEEYTLFSAPIYFMPDELNQTIFYAISSQNYALSGTFIINTESSSSVIP